MADTDSADTDSAGTDSAGTDSAGEGLAGTDSAGVDSADTDSTGTDLSGSDSAGEGLAETNVSGADSAATDVSGKDVLDMVALDTDGVTSDEVLLVLLRSGKLIPIAIPPAIEQSITNKATAIRIIFFVERVNPDSSTLRVESPSVALYFFLPIRWSTVIIGLLGRIQ